MIAFCDNNLDIVAKSFYIKIPYSHQFLLSLYKSFIMKNFYVTNVEKYSFRITPV